MKKELLIREWTILAIISGVIVVCCGLSWHTRLRAKANLEGWRTVDEIQKKIEVEVVGAVLKSGKFQFSPGITLKEVLKETRIAKSADRKKINFKKVFYISERIEIPSKTKKSKSKAAPMGLFPLRKCQVRQNLIV